MSQADEIQKLTTLVNSWDPLGLLASGAPDDEYDCLVKGLYPLLQKKASPDEIENFLLRKFEDHFGMGPSSVSENNREKYRNDIAQFARKVSVWRQKREG